MVVLIENIKRPSPKRNLPIPPPIIFKAIGTMLIKKYLQTGIFDRFIKS
jgi:hypothetical protein